MVPQFQLDKKSVQKFDLGQEPKDVLFWRTQPYAVRLAALEDIRQAYILWNMVLSKDFKEFIALLNAHANKETELDGVTVRFIGLEDLIKNKR